MKSPTGKMIRKLRFAASRKPSEMPRPRKGGTPCSERAHGENVTAAEQLQEKESIMSGGTAGWKIRGRIF